MSRGLDRAARSVAARRRRSDVERAMRELADAVGAGTDIRGLRLSRGGVLVARVISRSATGADSLLRLATDPRARADLRRLHHTLETLHATVDAPLRVLVPRPLALVERDEQTWQLESLLPGTPPMGASIDTGLVDEAARAIEAIHGETARSVSLTSHELERLIAVPCRSVQASLGRSEADAAVRISDRVHRLLEGRTVRLGRIHGDFWSGNLLADPTSGRLSGIVDWDRSTPDDLLTHDLRHLVLTAAKPQTGLEIGEAVRAILDGQAAAWSSARARMQAEEPEEAEALWLAYWLRFAAIHLTRFGELATDSWWMRRNMAPVLGRYAA